MVVDTGQCSHGYPADQWVSTHDTGSTRTGDHNGKPGDFCVSDPLASGECSTQATKERSLCWQWGPAAKLAVDGEFLDTGAPRVLV